MLTSLNNSAWQQLAKLEGHMYLPASNSHLVYIGEPSSIIYGTLYQGLKKVCNANKP